MFKCDEAAFYIRNKIPKVFAENSLRFLEQNKKKHWKKNVFSVKNKIIFFCRISELNIILYCERREVDKCHKSFAKADEHALWSYTCDLVT